MVRMIVLKKQKLLILALSTLLIITMSACGGDDGTSVAEQLPTHTLAPLVTLTPRFTATPVVTRTPLPTFTLTPSETPIPPTPSNTFTPTEVPPVIGIVVSLETVNVRRGPGGSFPAFVALDSGTGVEVLGTNPEETWLNVKLEDGQEGWIFAPLVRIEPTPTVFPTFTPSPDLTALALGTPLPTAIIGGGTVTPTPPRSVVTPTLAGEDTEPTATLQPTNTLDLPVVDVTAINLTATALAEGISATATPLPTVGSTQQSTGATTPQSTSVSPTPSGDADVRTGVDVLAYCDDVSAGAPPPMNLAAGSTLDVYWAWFARTEEQIRQHVANANYEVRINGDLLEDWENFIQATRQEADGNYWVYWYVPTDPLPAGEIEITYRLTWDAQITDGYGSFGPGSSVTENTGSCTFFVE